MKRHLLFIFISINTLSIFAQAYSFNDAQLWFNLYVEKKISNKFSAHINQQDRWTNNVSTFNFAYADVGLTYKISKNIKILADYVFTQKRINIQDENMDHYFGTIHQYYVAMTFKKEIRRWRFMYRQMYQFQFNNPYTSAQGLIPFHYDRNKFIVKYFYNKRYTFYAAEEIYIPLNSPQIKGIDRTRTFLGLFYTLMKGHQIEVYFMYQSRIQNGAWFKEHNYYNASNYMLEKDFVYGIGYSINF
jgi:hypothetical protein